MSYDSVEGVRQYAAAHGLPFRVAHDTGGSNAEAFGGVRATPTTVVIDRQGRIVEQQRGALDWGHMRTVLQGLLEQPA
jgi:peroxiredoxin